MRSGLVLLAAALCLEGSFASTAGGRGGLSTTFTDPAGYRLQILVLGGFNQWILAPGTGSSTILFVGPEDVYEDLEHAVNILFNADPAQPRFPAAPDVRAV